MTGGGYSLCNCRYIAIYDHSAHPTEYCPIFVALVSLHFLPLLRLIHHHLNAGVLLIFYFLKHFVVSQVLQVPLM